MRQPTARSDRSHSRPHRRHRPNACRRLAAEAGSHAAGISAEPQEAAVSWWVTVLSPHGKFNSELALGSRTSGKGRGRRAKGRRHVVRVGEVSRVRRDRPPTMAGAVFDTGAQKTIRILSLDAVVTQSSMAVEGRSALTLMARTRALRSALHIKGIRYRLPRRGQFSSRWLEERLRTRHRASASASSRGRSSLRMAGRSA